jgi:endo-1,4-beta-xylanase
MRVRGHTEVRRNQNRAWLTAGSWTREQIRELLEVPIDNFEWPGPERNAAFELLRDLGACGVSVHGIGFQRHLRSGGGVPSTEQLHDTFERFIAELGLVIELTELDVRIARSVTAEKLTQQAEEYRRVIDSCLRSAACETVVGWGAHDGNTWVDDPFPADPAPLLFEHGFDSRPAYRSVNEHLEGR